jgi:hypothetical protein
MLFSNFRILVGAPRRGPNQGADLQGWAVPFFSGECATVPGSGKEPVILK